MVQVALQVWVLSVGSSYAESAAVRRLIFSLLRCGGCSAERTRPKCEDAIPQALHHHFGESSEWCTIKRCAEFQLCVCELVATEKR